MLIMADEKTDTTEVEDEETPDGSEEDAHDKPVSYTHLRAHET